MAEGVRGQGRAHQVFGFIEIGAGDDNHQPGHGTDHQGIDKRLHHRHQSFAHRLVGAGGGVRHRRGAETGLVGEQPAGDTPADGFAHRGAAYRPGIECVLENRDERGRDRGKMVGQHQQRGGDIQDRHEGHQCARDLGDAFDAAEYDQPHRDRHRQSEQPAIIAHRRKDIRDTVDHGIGLHHVADTERGDEREDRESSGEAVHLQAVQQRIHGSAGDLTVGSDFAEFQRQRAFGEFGGHAHGRGDPHPEQRAGPAQRDGGGHAGDIAGADRGRQGGR